MITHRVWKKAATLFLGNQPTICKTVRPMLSYRCLVCLSVQSVMLVYCGQTVGWIQMKLEMEVDASHIVLDGDPIPPKGA